MGVPKEAPSLGGALPGIPEVRKKTKDILKENTMNRKSANQGIATRLHHAVCAFGLLISLAALPASGQQQVHQLLYNNSNWADQNLNGSPSITNGPIAAFLTTPNDQPHVYFLATNGHVHQHLDRKSTRLN